MKKANIAETATHQAGTVTDEFHDFYRRHSGSVYRTALRVTGNPTDAEDVLQNVFIRFLDRKVILDPRRSPKGYMQRAAVNAAIDLLRRRTSSPSAELEEGRESSDLESSPYLKEMLRTALAKLPSGDAELFVLCYLEGYTYEELADQFGIERGTIGSRLYRIKSVLKKELGM